MARAARVGDHPHCLRRDGPVLRTASAIPKMTARDSHWFGPAAALLLTQHTILLLMSWSAGFHSPPPTFGYALVALVLSLIGGLALLLWAMRKASLAEIWQRTDLLDVTTYLLGFQLLGLAITGLTWGKELMPLFVSYWADPAIAHAERSMLGVDAWRLVPEALVRPLDGLYTSWALAKFAALLTVLSMPPSAFKTKALLAYFLTVGLLGVFGQYLLPSVGPALFDQFHGGSQFAALRERLSEHAPIVHAATTYLWNAYSEDHMVFGGGISAMPSMHVATTTWVALVISSAFPRLKIPAWCFWFVILSGSVATGWHYLLDGVVGTAGAVMFWRLASIRARSAGLWLRRLESRTT